MIVLEGEVAAQVSSVVADTNQKRALAIGLGWQATVTASLQYHERMAPWSASINGVVQRTVFSASATQVVPEKIVKELYFSEPLVFHGTQCLAHKYKSQDVACVEQMSTTEPQHVIDCKTLSATRLRKKYAAEANSHRNMLQRAPGRGNVIHPDFLKFSSFLAHVGPMPCRGASLDRINNNDLEYAPDKVRWADRRTQNSNKGDTLLFQNSRTNKSYTVSHLARLQKISPSTVRKRLHRGWTDDEIIEGERGGASGRLALHPQSFVRHHCSIRSQPAAHEKTCREIAWERRVRHAEWHRVHEGEEYCLADPETLNEVATEVGLRFSREVYQRKFAKWWAEWKPHLRKNRLPLWAQGWIAEIEGSSSELANRAAQLRDHL